MNIFSRKEKSKTGRRETRYAGSWYEGDPKKLEAELKGYLASASVALEDRANEKETDGDKPLYAIIVPHAGYIYSGATAGFAYELAERFSPKRVFLLGPSHYVGFQGVALSPDVAFETPLGELQLDREVIEELRQYPMFEESREVHQREHSLELQLSFIRQALGNVKLVPLVVGSLPDIADVRLVGQIIRRYLREDDLVIVSSDFTHYGPRYDYMPFESDIAKEKVRELDFEAFECLKNSDLEAFLQFHSRTRCTICGFFPCAVLLSMLPSSSKAELLRYATSRDVTQEDGDNSVSYLAVSFTDTESSTGWKSEQPIDKEELLSEEEKVSLLKLARTTVESFVKEGKAPNSQDAGIDVTIGLKRRLGVFVTLFKKKQNRKAIVASCKKSIHDEYDLRGCIGYIWPIKPLVDAVIDNAVGACSKDYRFIPVRDHELPDLKYEISVLTPLQRVDSEKDIEIGRHGIVLYVKGRQSVFLPHVPVEFGWSLEETLSQLSVKAGVGPHDWRQGAKFDVFESIMFEEFELESEKISEN